MNRFILFVAAAALSAGCTAGKYIINGTADDPSAGGTAYLIAGYDTAADTLSSAAITGGKFRLEGSVPETVLARVAVDGMWKSVELFVDNGAVFDVAIGNAMSVSGGGKAQELSSKFAAIREEGDRYKSLYSDEYYGALQANDSATAARIENIFKTISGQTATKEVELIREYPDDFVSAYNVYRSMHETDMVELKEKYAALGEKGRSFPEAAAVRDRIAAMEIVEPGRIAPDFTLAAPDGSMVSLHGTRARVKLIDFWASWCAPCRMENPHIVELYDEFHGLGLEIIGVSLDSDPAKWKKAVEDDGLLWPQCSDLEGWGSPIVKTYMVEAIPHTVLIDGDNKIVACGLGGYELRARIEKMLR